MSTAGAPSAAEPAAGSPIRIGALVPLTPPGWVEAGRHLLAGMELAVRDVDGAGGIGGRPVELVVRDTAADPPRAAAAVDELAGLGVAAIAGEFHSVVARAAAARADALGLPFLCSSAVIDALTEQPTRWVARLAPAQSHGWRIYADFLLAAGHRRIAVATEPSAYWEAGVRILRDHLVPRGGVVVEFDARALGPDGVRDGLVEGRATALLLLVGHPEPAVPIVRAVRRDPRLADVLLGAPAGQPELDGWASLLGDDGAGVPFLRYLPERLGPLGERVEAALRERLGATPSFVAFEGYDAVAFLAEVLRAHGPDRERIAGAWPRVVVEGTRGTIRLAQTPGVSGWQWAWPPVQVADRDPARPDRFRVRHVGPAAVTVRLPTALVARYRAVDREHIGSPIVDTPAHLDALTASAREHGIQVPLRLGFTADAGALDGNHRIAVALRLDLPEVPVELVREVPGWRPGHSRPMRPEDLAVLVAAYEGAAGN
ncbi:ABC transporter substrate-binding protein [Pseudonocardia lacus]|uniref:ABC transporter substrate-binding protein n=1 Tax=Pseudonocardia lacus TaxID=2835865 RepID=UPI001BDD3132|nr:ABC transporter substrate-binding protein [Pseudonocardia lacus]